MKKITTADFLFCVAITALVLLILGVVDNQKRGVTIEASSLYPEYDNSISSSHSIVFGYGIPVTNSIVFGYGIPFTNSYEFAFGGCGYPVKRVKMTHEEFVILDSLLRRAKEDGE